MKRITRQSSVDEVLEALSDYIDDTGLSMRHVARNMSCGTGTISKLRCGTYQGNVEKVKNKIADFLILKTQVDENENELELFTDDTGSNGSGINKRSTLQEVRTYTKRYLADSRMTQSDLCRLIVTDKSRFSQWLKGTYPGDNEALRRLVVEYFQMLKHRQVDREIKTPFYRTKQSMNIIGVMNVCYRAKKMGLIVGRAGIGKSFTLEYYKGLNPMCHVITCWPGMTSLDILDEILDQFSEAVGIPGRRRRFKKIQKLLKGTNVLIVFDESQHLLRQHLDTIRTVWDFCKVGIVLMGNETTYDQMHGRQYLSFEQVKSRFTPIRKVNAAMRKDDVREIIHSMGLNVNNDAVDFCYQEAKKWDFFRTVQNIMEQASMMLSGENTEIDVSLLQKAAVYLRS